MLLKADLIRTSHTTDRRFLWVYSEDAITDLMWREGVTSRQHSRTQPAPRVYKSMPTIRDLPGNAFLRTILWLLPLTALSAPPLKRPNNIWTYSAPGLQSLALASTDKNLRRQSSRLHNTLAPPPRSSVSANKGLCVQTVPGNPPGQTTDLASTHPNEVQLGVTAERKFLGR